MGNEMGNNNTSDLKVEDNTDVIDPKNLLQEAADADNVKEENQIVPTPDAKYFYEEVTGLASDDPTGAKDPLIEYETSGGREEEENEVHPLTASPKAEMQSIEAGNEDCEFRPASSQKNSEFHEKTTDSNLEESLLGTSDNQLHKQASINEEQEENEIQPPAESLRAVVKSIEASGEDSEIKPAYSPNDSEVQEKPTDSNLEENLLGTSNHQLEKQASVSKEEEGTRNSTFNTVSTPHNPEPRQCLQLKSDQHELDKVNANLSEGDGSGLLKGSEDILGSSLKSASEENGHLLGPDISINPGDNPNVQKEMGDSLVKEVPSKEENMPFKEKIEITDGDEVEFGLRNLATTTSETPTSVRNKYNGELSTEASSNRNDSLNSLLENVVLDKPLNSHQEVSEPEDKCMVFAEETKIVGSGSEDEEEPHEYNPSLFCEVPEREPNTVGANGSESEFRKIGSENEDYEMRSPVDISSHFRSIKNCQIKEAKVAENAYQVDVFVSNQNKTSDGCRKDSEQEFLVVSEHGMVPVPAELIVTDRRCEEQAEEKKIVEEIEDNVEASYATENDTKGGETTTQGMSQPLLVEQAEAFLSESPASIVQSQVHNWATTMAPETIQRTYELIPELKQESQDEFFVVNFSNFSFTSLTAENLVSAVEKPGKDLSQYEEITRSASQSSVQGVKGEVSAFANGRTEAQETVGRLSTESNPDNMNTYVQMRKSPSFDIDLRIEARGKESDQTPLLFQDKDTTGSTSSQSDVSLGNSIAHVGYNQDKLRCHSMAVEEKVITLEKSDSEKSRTPFLGFLKEEEEAQIVVTPQKQENHAAAKKATRELCDLSISPPHKGKEKRKPRSSFFGNCMCCATVIN